ncbi:MAG: chromosomal replication initiator protein DnaA [Alphaproteobacteria bacterium]|nr:chromosomal replication initiator protein DnaA [Alphaproteobacteria bacterium]
MFEGGNTIVHKDETTGSDSLSSLATYAAGFEIVKAALKSDIGETAFRSWILPLEARRFDAGALDIRVPTRFIRDWVRTHYGDRLTQLCAQHIAGCTRIDYSIQAAAKPAAADAARPYEPVTTANENAAAEAAAEQLSSALDPRFTFDNFIVAPSNELAFAAAKKLASGENVTFNPLFLQGGVGLGKTHLMQAIAQDVAARAPEKRVVYMSAEKFMYQFVRALRSRDTMTFKEYVRGVDILMIDDIQFICGKESTAQEFFHTFNALMDQGKQVVLSADKAPGDLEGLDDRLRSRLGMGLVAGIQNTSLELRLDILRAKCVLMKREMPADVLGFLAEKITNNVRELEGALNRLIAHAELVGRAITLAGAEELLQDLLRAAGRRITIEDIQRRVADHYNLRMTDILSPRRARPVARPRQVAMYLAKALTEHSLPEIGRKFGGRDHTTIIHGVRKIEELLLTDRQLAADIETLKQRIAG